MSLPFHPYSQAMRRFITILPLLLWCISTLINANETFYRYTNSSGIITISSRIPAEYVTKGYQIITLDGRVIKTVPPEPSEEEKKRLEQEREQQKLIERWDQELLARYSSAEEIVAAKERKLLEIDSQLGINERSIEKIRNEIDSYQSIAANDERSGRVINETVLNTIELLKTDLANEKEKTQILVNEKHDIVEQFEKDEDRYRTLRP